MYLCREYLGYDKLTDAFHGPMLSEWDRQDAARFRGDRSVAQNCGSLWPRGHYKTWCERARVIRYFLYDPAITVIWWHAVEDRAVESGDAIGEVLQKNKTLRKLFPPGVLPSPFRSKFMSGGSFRLDSARVGEADSFRAFGAGAEATGGHARVGVLDDPVGLNDVMDSQMPKKKQWYQLTVTNVIHKDTGWKDYIGTRWDLEDLPAYLLPMPNWKWTVRAAVEDEQGKADLKGKPVLLSEKDIENDQAEAGEAGFAMEMQNDPSPAGEKPWDAATCEHEVITRGDAMKGAGKIAVITDPAPAKLGSPFPGAARDKQSTEKNWWTYAAVRFRVNGQRREMILLELRGSREWSPSDGWGKVCKAAQEWRTPWVSPELVGMNGTFYESDIQAAARKIGAQVTLWPLADTMKGKNYRFAKLADKAKGWEFLICETALVGEGAAEAIEAFLFQARNWRPNGGKNGLRFDDFADVVAMGCDSAFDKLAPQPIPMDEQDEENEPAYYGRSRYCAM